MFETMLNEDNFEEDPEERMPVNSLNFDAPVADPSSKTIAMAPWLLVSCAVC